MDVPGAPRCGDEPVHRATLGGSQGCESGQSGLEEGAPMRLFFSMFWHSFIRGKRMGFTCSACGYSSPPMFALDAYRAGVTHRRYHEEKR